MVYQPSPPREADKIAVVAELRSVLAQGDDAAGAVRSCYYRHPLFSVVVLHEVLSRRFGPDCDVRELTALIARIRREPGRKSFPSREAEAIIRALLGEVVLDGMVDPMEISYPEVGIAVLSKVLAEWRPDRVQADALMDGAEALLAVKLAERPELAAAEQRWFDAGMPESPFAFPFGQAGEPGEQG